MFSTKETTCYRLFLSEELIVVSEALKLVEVVKFTNRIQTEQLSKKTQIMQAAPRAPSGNTPQHINVLSAVA